MIGILLSGRIISVVNLNVALFYGIIILLLFMYFPQPKNLRIQNGLSFAFVCVVFVSIILNDINPFFKPYQRFASFLLNLVVFGPLFFSNSLIRLRISLFLTLCKVFTILTLFSFFGLMTGVFPLQGFGGFQGITVHAMTLSAIAGASFIYLMYVYFIDKATSSYKQFLQISMVICFFVIVISASRAALLASIASSLLFIYKFKGGNFIKTLKPVLLIILLVSITFPLWQDYADRIFQKFESNKSNESLISSRENLWEARINEFSTSPLYGIGFGNLLPEFNDYGINEETGGIETGSSWGMVLSMTGVLGVSFICVFLFKVFQRANKTGTLHSFFLQALLLYFIIHMTFEGYIFASGNILMIFFWLLVSVVHYQKFDNKLLYNSDSNFLAEHI